jgi:hypothetical protein
MLSGGMAFASTMTVQLVPNAEPGVGNPVPEPATWAMLVLGFGFIGGAMRIAGRGRVARAAA